VKASIKRISKAWTQSVGGIYKYVTLGELFGSCPSIDHDLRLEEKALCA